MVDAQDYPTAQLLRDLDHLNAAWRCLDDGDVSAAWQRLEAAPQMLRATAEFHHLLAAALVSAGQLEQAAASADAYAQRRPDAFDGIELAGRIHTALGTERSRDALAKLNARRAQLVLQALEREIVAHGADWPRIVTALIVSNRYSNAFKARTLTYLFDNVLGPDEKARVADRLVETDPQVSAADRALSAGTLMLHCGRTAEALAMLEAVIAKGGLGPADFPALVAAVNHRVGWGDEVAFDSRYRILSALYEAWTAKLWAAIPQPHRQAVERIEARGHPSRKVAILSPPLLNQRHAPTNRVLEIAASLKRDFGYDVTIFAGGALTFRTSGAMPSVIYSSVTPTLARPCTITHDGVELPLWATFLDDSQILKFTTVALEIARFDPDVVLCYGDASPVQALLSGRLPVVLFPSNSTPPVGPADRYVSLWDEAALRDRVEAGTWPEEIAAKAAFASTGVRYPKPRKRVPRDQLAPGADLLAAIVGTRIAGEARGEFARRLADFLAARPGAHLLTIGDPNREAVLGEELAPVADRVHVRGYEANLCDLLTGCDIVLNPPRQGGGTGIAMAMSAGCPVVSLADGDGATLLDGADLSRDLDGFFARLADLADNPALRAEVGARMPARADAVLDFDRGMAALVAVLEDTAKTALATPG